MLILFLRFDKSYLFFKHSKFILYVFLGSFGSNQFLFELLYLLSIDNFPRQELSFVSLKQISITLLNFILNI
jgi:hypothetical protein